MTLQDKLSRVATVVTLVLVCTSAGAQTTEELPPLYVRTIVFSEAEPTITRQFFGRIAALDTIDLAFEVGGKLDVLDATEGQPIAQGSLLAALDQEPFERAVSRAELALAQSERDLERVKVLADRNVSSTENEQNARTARDLAELSLRDAQMALEDSRIVSPFDALIANRIASQDTIVEPGQPIVRLHDMSETRVEFDLPERLVRQVGDPEMVAFEGLLPDDDQPFPLEFREIRVETGPVGQSYELSLAIAVKRLPRFLPGQAIIIRASVPNPDPSPSLPPEAIGTAPNGQTYVVAVDRSGGKLVARHIDVNVTSPTGSTLRVTGLPSGTEVVAVGVHSIADGAILARYAGISGGSE